MADNTAKNNDTEKKRRGLKDLSPEEKSEILARATKGSIMQLAEEYGITWQAIAVMRREEARKTRLNLEANAQTSENAEKNPEDFTEKEKLFILARVKKLGIKKVAQKTGVSEDIIKEWRKAMKKAPAFAPAEDQQPEEPVTKILKQEKNEAVSTSKMKDIDAPTSLEIENAILKEKISELTKQVERLRSAVKELA